MNTDGPTRTRAQLVSEPQDASVPALVHPGWLEMFPWLVQGTTTRGAADVEFDLGLFAGASPGHVVHEHWNRLLANTGMTSAIHARQLHEAEVRVHRDVVPGLTVAEPCDGHATVEPGVLLAVATADCVPVFVVAPTARAVAILHAGWRGVAAGVLERGLSMLVEEARVRHDALYVHLGPSICGDCYEVGHEVFEALSQSVPAGPAPIDLRGILADRAEASGVSMSRITTSEHCTRCTGSELFSHRGGDRGRQVGYLGIRA